MQGLGLLLLGENLLQLSNSSHLYITSLEVSVLIRPNLHPSYLYHCDSFFISFISGKFFLLVFSHSIGRCSGSGCDTDVSMEEGELRVFLLHHLGHLCLHVFLMEMYKCLEFIYICTMCVYICIFIYVMCIYI